MTRSEEPYEVGAVANFMIGRAKKNRRPLTHLKLQNLVYLAYGIYLASNTDDRRLFKQHVEAWQCGPVVPELYHEFKRFGTVPIRDWSTDFNYETREFTFPVAEDNDDRALFALNLTWSLYGDLSLADLKKITHQPGSPWERTMSRLRRTLPSGIPRTISDEWIKLEFDEILNDLAGVVDLGTEEIVYERRGRAHPSS